MLETESENSSSASSESRIATNMRTLLILEVVGSADHALTPTEINAHLGLPKQSIHRLCTTLVEEGFLVYVSNGKGLRPARRLRMMASGILYSSRLHIARHKLLEEVAARVGETVNFAVPGDKGMNYIDRVETGWAFRVQLPVGTHVPFHCTASGKTFLASLRGAVRKKMLMSLEIEALTHNTISSSSELETELKRIRKDGYALDREEFMDGMVAIAVPVVDGSGRFLAALAFHGPTLRLNEEKLMKQRHYLQDAASRLAQTMIDD